jgi:thymidylate kinase
MPVVFLDGVDGSGKTTLLNQLARALAPAQTSVAPPLWRFLPDLTTPADFGPWVTSTDADHIAVALLTGQTHRIHTIRSLSQDAADPVVLLVDRGPATVIASARAHLRTGIRTGNHERIDLTDHIDRLRNVVRSLSDETACLSIELAADGCPDRILNRLTLEDRTNPDYLRYLHALRSELSTGEPAWAGLRQVCLDATQPIGITLSTAVIAIHEMPGAPGSARDIDAPED